MQVENKVVTLIKDVFEARKRKNERYSLRAFAQSLDIHSAALSMILAGKRPLSGKQAARFLDKLGITESETRAELIASSVGAPAPAKPVYSKLDFSRFAVIRDWEHHAILACFHINLLFDESELAQKLDLPLERVCSAIDRLVSVGLLEKCDGQVRVAKPHVATPTDIPSEDLRECHRQFIHKALDSLANDSVEIRDVTGITMTVNPDKLSLLKKAIQEFRHKLADLADDENASAVYRMNIQFFPLTKEEL